MRYHEFSVDNVSCLPTPGTGNYRMCIYKEIWIWKEERAHRNRKQWGGAGVASDLPRTRRQSWCQSQRQCPQWHHCLFGAVLIGVAIDLGWPGHRVFYGFSPRRVIVGTFGHRWDFYLDKVLCDSTHGDLAGFSWITIPTGNSCISSYILNGSFMSMDIDIYILWKSIAWQWPFMCISNTVDPLHMNLQVSSFQRCERAFACAVM